MDLVYDKHAWKSHSSVDLFRRSETSDSRINGDISPEQIISRGKDNDRLSSLPILPPLPPLLLPRLLLSSHVFPCPCPDSATDCGPECDLVTSNASMKPLKPLQYSLSTWNEANPTI
jgi:hypothetical protein